MYKRGDEVLVTRNFFGGGVWSLTGCLEIFLKKGALVGKGWRKTGRGDVTLKKTMDRRIVYKIRLYR